MLKITLIGNNMTIFERFDEHFDMPNLVSAWFKAFLLAELEALKKELLSEADNPHNMALLNAERKQEVESAVDVEDIKKAFKRRGI